MAWTDLRTLTTTSCVLVLTACGDSGGREDSGSTPATTTSPSSVSLTMDSTASDPTTNPTTGATATTGVSVSASGTTGDDTGSTTAVSASNPTGDPTGNPTGNPTSETATTTETGSTGGGPCLMGQIECEGNIAKVCAGMGGYSSEMPCAKACADLLGCVECVPGSYQCVGEVSQVCNDAGTAWVDETTCDAVQGLTCDPGTGA